MLHKRQGYKKIVLRQNSRYYAHLSGFDEIGSRRMVSCKNDGVNFAVKTSRVDSEGWVYPFYTAALYRDFAPARVFCDTLLAGITGAF